jgi:hypothetical protein
LILGALGATDAQWPSWIQHVAEKTEDGGAKVRFQNTVIRLRDDLGQSVPDYFVEFYRTGGSDDRFEQSLYQKFLESVHPYGDDPSYRALYLDINVLDKLRPRINTEGGLHISFRPHRATPRASPRPGPKTTRRLPARARKRHRRFACWPPSLIRFLRPTARVLMDVRIHRQVDEVVFR